MRWHCLDWALRIARRGPAFLLAAVSVGCGAVRTGTIPAPDDPVPVGAVVVQGRFGGLNGKEVSGTAAIYLASSTGAHVVRLEGLSAPSESGLILVAKANGSTVLSTSLRDHRGNQNYSLSSAVFGSWESVVIRSAGKDMDYGSALLE